MQSYEQRDEAISAIDILGMHLEEARSRLTAQAHAELLLARERAATSAGEIHNSIRAKLQTIESWYKTEVSEDNAGRNRLVVDHDQRVGERDRPLQSSFGGKSDSQAASRCVDGGIVTRSPRAYSSVVLIAAHVQHSPIIAQPWHASSERDAHVDELHRNEEASCGRAERIGRRDILAYQKVRAPARGSELA